MEKKESQDKLFSEIKLPSKHKLMEFLLILLKFTVGICLLPIVYGVSVCFARELIKLEPLVIHSFIRGIAGFLVVYLFVWEPAVLYKKGQRILEVLFRFFAPLVKVAPFVLPIYTILIFLIYFILVSFMDVRNLLPVFLFGAGFSLALHLVFSARTLRSKEGNSLKANYIFGFSWIYILDAFLLALFFNLAFENFSILVFLNGSCQLAKNIYQALFSQMFL